MQRRRLLASSVAALTLPLPARSGNAAPAALETMAEDDAARRNVCSVAFATLSGGDPQPSHAVDRCGPPPAAPIYQAASLAKPVFAYLVLKLVDQKVLALDDPIGRYLPQGYMHRQNLLALNRPPVEDLVPPSQLRRITVRMLLTHSSGLPNWSSDGPLAPSFEPGTDWKYSGEGYVLLQRAVEAAATEPLDRLADRLVFPGLGMRQSSFRLSPAVAGHLVQGSTASGEARQLRFPFAVASSSLYTSADDYAKFMAAVLQDKAMTSRITDGAVNVSRRLGLKWGLGWGVEESPQGTHLWHWGNNPGYRCLAMASLQSLDGIAVFTNSDAGMPTAKSIVRAGLPGEHGALSFAMLG
jgi:CubicO group peptidase (beta-lactamase class C family)